MEILSLDSLLSAIGWTKEDLYTLESKLAAANCISAARGDPTVIGWQRTGLSKFFYSVFSQPLTESQINQYNDGCRYIFYKYNVVLEYGGGAVGRQCFEGVVKMLYSNNHALHFNKKYYFNRLSCNLDKTNDLYTRFMYT